MCLSPTSQVHLAPNTLTPLYKLLGNDDPAYVLSGAKTNDKITRIVVHYYDGKMTTISNDFGTITITPDHPIKTNEGWVRAGDLTTKHKIEFIQTRLKTSYYVPWQILEINGRGWVYNLETEGEENSYMTAIGLVQTWSR